jgi:hypothetical protein
MIAASDYRLPGLTWAAETKPAADAGLFAFLDELRECEKRRDELLNRLSIEESGDQIEAVAKTACDAARAIYARIATIKPTTVAGCSDNSNWRRAAGLRHRRCRSPWRASGRSLAVRRP